MGGPFGVRHQVDSRAVEIMTDRKRPLWPLLTAALIGLPVLYVATFGAWFTWARVKAPLARPLWAERIGVHLFRPIGAA